MVAFQSHSEHQQSSHESSYGSEKRGTESLEGDTVIFTEKTNCIRKPSTWRWRLILLLIYLTSLINGYDVSNVANIQAPVYEAFGHIQLLPWVALSCTMGAVAVTPLVRRIVENFDTRMLSVVFYSIFIMSCAVSGSATSIHALIIGRVLMGVGYTGIYQLNLVFVSMFAGSKEATRIAGAVGLSWAVGIILGPFVGAGFAENRNATWRWAFYVNLPFLGLLLCVAAIFLPSFTIGSSSSLRKSLSKIDFIGSAMHCAVSLYYLPLFYAFACGASPIEAAVHVVPFLGFFIGSIILASIGLPLVGYYAVFFLLAGILTLVSGAFMTVITSVTPDQTILGHQVLLAIGIGLVFSHVYSVANASLDDPRERINSAALFSMALISGVCLALSAAGCVYHNPGSSSLQEEL